MRQAAEQVSGRDLPPFKLNETIASPSTRERPLNAIVSDVVNMIVEPFQRRAERCAAAERVAVPSPSKIVSGAISIGFPPLVAAGNDAYTLGLSHD